MWIGGFAMTKLNHKTRRADLAQMQADPLDVLVIGGGITGAGISLDAQTRGLKTGLIEMQDFAAGTSSRSTKLVHGGLRYLKQLAVHEVAEVGSERAIVYENAPHVTTPVWMMLPFYKNGTFGKATTALGLDVYDHLAQVKKNERKFMLNANQALIREPYLKAKGLLGAGVYVEYRTDDARLVIEVIKKAHAKGALVANYVKATELTYNVAGQVDGVVFVDQITGDSGVIHARRVINAAGPWVDTIRKLDGSDAGKHLHLTKGVHLVVDSAKFPLHNAVFFDTPFKDKRMMFAIPRAGKTYFGTTDTTWTKDPKEPTIDARDVTYILDAVNGMFDITPLTFDDVESAWAGVRPLIQEAGKSPSEISRKDEIFHSESGLYSIAGGKLTGYRKMAEKIMDKVAKDIATADSSYRYQPTQTKHLPLAGGDPLGSDGFKVYAYSAIGRGVAAGLTKAQAKVVVAHYGTNADAVFDFVKQAASADTTLSPLDYGQLHYGLENELVLRPIDFLLRRSGELLFDYAHMQAITPAVIAEMRRYFNWSEATTLAMTSEVSAQVKLRQNFKDKINDVI
ncbi:glycerol-3-phosphate dehydrogenase [Agrilactobacillus composti DSM 18527 = JCM 14202]|uniref:Alpha-glycerophosphate oxidase n=2 Tax=Agrilactobacillus TaxID=2767875 RepID=A0A0R1XZY0_9LACO|nr:glycerol-3-phosphate dehydrogenase [Agrilactobacillus composti DSM 18527 = JCM 14202]